MTERKETPIMHFILDCDDVLLDWIRGFRSWLFDVHRIKPTTDVPSSWSLAEWLDMSDDRCRDLIEMFNGCHRFGQLSAIPDAVDAVARLKAYGHKLTVLTSCSADPSIVNRRKENLRREFGDSIDRVICLDLAESKSKWLEVLRGGIWVEDNYRNAVAGYRAGHKTFMMRRSHNREDERSSLPHIAWVDDFRPILSSFT